MTKRRTSSADPEDQHARFVEAAREAGADVDSDAADRLMGKLAKMPPDPKLKPAKKSSSIKSRA